MCKAYQRIIREKKQSEKSDDLFALYPDIIDIKTSVVKEIDYKTAQKIILEYEWLGCMPTIVLYCYGIYFNGFCGGVVCYGTEYGENLGIWDKYGYTGKIILLSRGACVWWAHPHSASKLIRTSMKMLPDKYKVVTATIDNLAGEIGTIYQACGFHYVGRMRDGKTRFGVNIKGKLYGSRAIRQKIGSQKPKDILKKYPDATFVKQLSKDRYFAFMGTKKEKKKLLESIADIIKPYPKRE